MRYADDLIIMVGSKQAAEPGNEKCTRFIEEKLGLKVNAEKSKVDKPKGIKYLGFGFYFDAFARDIKPDRTESSREIQSTDEETDMQKLGSEQQLQSAETEPAYPRMDKLFQNRGA